MAATKGAGAGRCASCGKKADVQATVWVGRQASGGSGAPVEWRPYEAGLCEGCIDAELDGDGYGLLVWLALQVCWIPLATRGPSALGIGGAAIALYGLWRLVSQGAGALWKRRHADDGATPPAWMRMGEAPEERASEALKELMRDEAAREGLLVETLGEHERGERRG